MKLKAIGEKDFKKAIYDTKLASMAKQIYEVAQMFKEEPEKVAKDLEQLVQDEVKAAFPFRVKI